MSRMCVYGGSFVFGDRRLGEFKLITRDASINYEARAYSEM